MTGTVPKALYIRTYGCQMNVYDSARIVDVLAPLGFVSVDDPAVADLIVLNTCHIRDKAAEKVYSELGRLQRLRRSRIATGKSGPLIAVAGCVAQAEGDELIARAPFVDLVVGPQSYHRLPALLAERSSTAGPPQIVIEFPAVPKFDLLPEARLAAGACSAFLTVQEGCDRFCSFCVVPYTRGAEQSRPVAQVVAEARRYAAEGVVEITLLGQNVNAYHGEAPDGSPWDLAQLIEALAEIDGLARLRYTTSHPADMSEALIAAHGRIGALMPYLHLPVQAGSDRVLAAMNRRHTADFYRRIVDRLRKARPDLALSSDFIVGFPGESDADFAATLSLVEEIGFVQAYSFKYSPRPGTPAALLPQLDDQVKSERLLVLQELLDRQSLAFNERAVGRTVEVLFDRRGRHAGQLAGRSPYMQAVHADVDDAILGRIVPVIVTGAGANSLSGHLFDRVAA